MRTRKSRRISQAQSHANEIALGAYNAYQHLVNDRRPTRPLDVNGFESRASIISIIVARHAMQLLPCRRAPISVIFDAPNYVCRSRFGGRRHVRQHAVNDESPITLSRTSTICFHSKADSRCASACAKVCAIGVLLPRERRSAAMNSS